jgi:hypothetical protein
MADFTTFSTWDEVLDAARRGDMLYYQAPLDRAPRYVAINKVYKNGTLRIDPLSRDADKFTADAGHLLRFRKRT